MSDLDQFYTMPEIAEKLLKTTLTVLGIADESKHTFLEPSAGTGSFSRVPTHCLAYDLEPKSDGIIRADFLQVDLDEHNNLITIGNPPFGKRAVLAVEFFNKCAKRSDAIAMILPNQFNKHLTQKRLNPDFSLIYAEPLGDVFTTPTGKVVKGIRTTFQIWIKNGSKLGKCKNWENLRITEKPPISLPNVKIWQHNATPQSMSTVEEDWDYAVYRQGYKDYGKIFTKSDKDEIRRLMETGSDQFFFIKPLTEKAREIVLAIDYDKLALKNTTVKGFGKADFCLEYQRIEREMSKTC